MTYDLSYPKKTGLYGPPRPCLPKICGADMELGNFIEGWPCAQGNGYETSRWLLREMDGTIPQASTSRPGSSVLDTHQGVTPRTANEPEGFHSQDWGRKFLLNGGCAYIDLNHLEVCIPEVRHAYDHLAACHAMFGLAHQASQSLKRRLPVGLNPVVLANNTDGRGNAYGTHLNLLITRQLWQEIFHRRLQFQLFLAAFQASSLVITGLGKVGSENGRPDQPFQISQRADFMEVQSGLQTTYNRPLINSRDESLCDRDTDRARLHVIYYDNNLCHVAGFLKIGMLQIILAMMEHGSIDSGLILDDPVAATWSWSCDPELHAKARLVGGEEVTAVELQLRFLSMARRFVDSGAIADCVPHAQEILVLWGDTLEKLREAEWDALRGRLDWVLKRSLLEQAMSDNPRLDWTSPEIRYLDQIYSCLDPDRGLFYACLQKGLIETLVTESHINRLMHRPPPDTRAWTRALLLALALPEDLDMIDWHQLRFDFQAWPDLSPGRRLVTVRLGNPAGHTRSETEPLLPESATLEEVLRVLNAEHSPASGTNEPIIYHPIEPK